MSNSTITENYTREQFEAHFAENREITYKNTTIGIMEWGDGRYDILTPAENENGYNTLNPTPFTNPCAARDFAINHLVDLDKNSKPKAKKKKVDFDGPRIVRVYSRDVYVEENIDATNDQIRRTLVEQYNLPNFKAGNVFFDLDSSTGVLEVGLKFKTKG